LLVDDTRHSASLWSLVANCALEVARRLAWIGVDKGVRLAAWGTLASIAARIRLHTIDGLDVIASKVDIGDLLAALGWRRDALVVARAPWLAVLTTWATSDAVIAATRAVGWSSTCGRRVGWS